MGHGLSMRTQDIFFKEERQRQREVKVFPKCCMNDWQLLSRNFYRKQRTVELTVKMRRRPTAGKIKPKPTSSCCLKKKIIEL